MSQNNYKCVILSKRTVILLRIAWLWTCHFSFFSIQPSLWSNSHIHKMTTGKTIALTRWTLVIKVRSLLFNMLSRLVIGEGNGAPLQYSRLANPMDWEAWKAAVHGVAEGRTQLSDFTFTFHFPALEKEMATHSSVLAWRIPGTAKPGGLPSMGSHRVGYDWSDLAAAETTQMFINHRRNKYISE